VIINCLKKEPAPLSRPIWQKLRSYGLVRTPQERREYLLCNAPNSVKETTAYSSGVARALRGVLALDDRTRNLEVVFKSGVEAELDLLLHGWRVLINDKWLDFHASHDSGGCDLSVEASHQHVHIDTFDCGHITELYDSLVAELSRYQQRDRKLSAEASSALRRRAAEKIRQTPSRVSVAQGEKSGEIVVSWTEPESDRVWKNHRLLRKGRVTLHRESKCSHSKNEILSSKSSFVLTMPTLVGHLRNETGLIKAGEMAVDDDTASTDWVTVAACGCPEQIVPLKDSSATFTGLSQEEKYFPMISGIAPQSFFGFPPSALRPAAASQDLPANPNVDAVSSALDSTKSKETMQGDFNDLIDTSQDDDDDDDASKFYEDGNAGPYQSGTSTQTSISGSSNNSTRAGTPVSQQSSVNTQQARRSPTNIKLRVRKNFLCDVFPVRG
jgi:hypothetical protein